MKKSLLFGLIGLVVDIVVSGAVASYAVNAQNVTVQKMFAMNMNTDTDMSGSNMSMSEMNTALEGKTGDDFDKAFLSEMIVHHQGAIDMANLALKNANHQEVKDLAKDIVTAQTSEITKMQHWQMQWGYITTTSMPGMHM